MQVRDRVRELRRVQASALRPNPRNWRTHPAEQRQALQGILTEVGFADALLVRELPDGTLELIDGHLRAETTPDQEVPVLVLDVTEEEANKLLATLDPLAGMAEVDEDQLERLLKEVTVDDAALERLLAELAEECWSDSDVPMAIDNAASSEEQTLPERFSVLVECESETQQVELLQSLTSEGYKCRSLIV